jgi:hypothetical protein
MARKFTIPVSELIRLYESGESTNSIGRLLGWSPSTISNHLNAAGLILRTVTERQNTALAMGRSLSLPIRPLDERLEEHLDRRPGLGPWDNCHLWTGPVNPNTGHGYIYKPLPLTLKYIAVHRLAWLLTNRSIPDGLYVLRRCEQSTCCNLAHLYLGTNTADLALYERRFWTHVDKTPGLGPQGKCWEWTAPRKSNHYGSSSPRFGTKYAHRISWQLVNGPLVSSQIKVLHTCDNPPCVRPDHLFTGSQLDNMQDMIAKGRKVVSDRKGENHPKARLTWEKVRAIRAEYVPYSSTHGSRPLALKYGVSRSTIRSAVRRGWQEEGLN